MQIIKTLETHKSELKNFGVESIGVFGSFARGDQNDNSDIDLLVEIKREKKTLRNFMSFCEFLDSLFSDRRVDVVSDTGLSPFIGPHIKREVEYANL